MMLALGSGALITEVHTKELLSRAYIFAATAVAGFNISIRELDYGVDYTLHNVKVDAARTRRQEDGIHFSLQMKATVNWEHSGHEVLYDLEAKTWNDMVSRDPLRPLYLGLLCLAPDAASWFATGEDQAVLKHCCYWYDATGQAPTPNTSRVRIRIPRANVLDPDGLQVLMAKSRDAVESRR